MKPLPLRFLSATALMGALLAGLSMSGCVTNSGAGSAQGAGAPREIVTESDEPEARRRARIRLELASGYFAEGKPTVALDEIKLSLQNDPSYAEAYNLRGLVYMRLNDAAFAEDSFKRALALSPRDSNVAHNYGWMLCQNRRYSESVTYFERALSNPLYGDQAKTFMTQGLCQLAAGQKPEAERSLTRSYEIDAGNPITGFNLSSLMFERGELVRSQFYIRRINNSEFANSESLWLGVKVERRLNNREGMLQLVDQLKKRYPQSRELAAYERGAFNE
jgi:type IV pilus assembly protein PilF